MSGNIILVVVLALVLLFVVVVVFSTIKIVKQQRALIIERLGKYHRTLGPGPHFIIPFLDRVRADVSLSEQVVPFPPQPVITSDNLVVSIDTVIYYAVTNPTAAVYEISDLLQGVEQLTATTLRNIIGSLDLEQTLTSRDTINASLRRVLDEATGRWGIRVARVELKSIDPPRTVQDSMEKQMRAERDRRAAILTAEGVKQSQILTAEGEKQSQILRAEGSAQARILEAQGQARAIQQVFDAIHRGRPTQDLLAYQYLQTLPQIARGDSNKMWVIPAEMTEALRGFGQAFSGAVPTPPAPQGGDSSYTPPEDGGMEDAFADAVLQDPNEALKEARMQAQGASDEAEGHVKATSGEPATQAVPRVEPQSQWAVPPTIPNLGGQPPVVDVRPEVSQQRPETGPQEPRV